MSRDAFDSLSAAQRASYSSTISGLRDLFAKPSTLDAHTRLRDLRFDPRESLDSFIIRFRKLVSRAFPEQDADPVLFNCFLPTLPELYQSEIISAGISSFVGAVEKARNVRRAEERRAASAQSDGPGSATVRQVGASAASQSVVDQILSRISDLERQVWEGRTPARASSGTAPPDGAGGPFSFS